MISDLVGVVIRRLWRGVKGGRATVLEGTDKPAILHISTGLPKATPHPLYNHYSRVFPTLFTLLAFGTQLPQAKS